MGSFRSSIQVSSADLALVVLHVANTRATSKKIDLRCLHRTISHSRSLFIPSKIVKRSATTLSDLPHAILSPKMEADIQFMQVAIEEAEPLSLPEEVPIGAL